MASTYHVAKNGQDSDSWGGDQNHPWLTWNYAMKRIRGGDTVIGDNGIYNEALRNVIPSGTAASPTTLKALNPLGVTLFPQSGYYVIEVTKPLTQAVLDGIVTDGSKSYYAGYYLAVDTGDCSYITLQNGASKNNRSDGAYGPVGIRAGAHHNVAGHHHLSFLNMEAYDNKATNSMDGYGIYLTCHDSLLKGSRFYRNGSYALHKYCTNGGVDRNVITENVFDGTGMTASVAAVILASGSDNQFFKNEVKGAKGSGVDVYYGERNCKVYQNPISNNAGAAVRVSNQPTEPSGIEIYENNFDGNGHDGVQDDTGNANVHDNTTGAVQPPIPPIPPVTGPKKYRIVSGEITLEEIQ